jgi:hypothetical protein
MEKFRDLAIALICLIAIINSITKIYKFNYIKPLEKGISSLKYYIFILIIGLYY